MHADYEKSLFIFANKYEVDYLNLTGAVDNAEADQFSMPITPANADLLYRNAGDLMLRANNIDVTVSPYGADHQARIRMAESLKDLAYQALKVSTPGYREE